MTRLSRGGATGNTGEEGEADIGKERLVTRKNWHKDTKARVLLLIMAQGVRRGKPVHEFTGCYDMIRGFKRLCKQQ
jgi:hypothetical protein